MSSMLRPATVPRARIRSAHLPEALFAAILLLVGVVPANADDTPNLAPLRERLREVRVQQAGKIADGAFESIAYTMDVADRIGDSFAPQAQAWTARAERFLKLARQGKDPIVAQRGRILMRGYRSPLSTRRQGYAIYIPEDYDPGRSYPLMIVLHGGSANGNLFLGVVLGNNMNWKDYPIHLWDDFEPRWSPDWIVVAPDGFGQVMWRWMGERDVLDVIADVEKHYSVDPDRVVLCGLSNGGVGAYSIGLRHAWRFAAVLAIAGAPSWLQYAGGTIDDVEARSMHAVSGMSLADNAVNTDFRYYHGYHDTGPMRPSFVEEFGKRIRTLGVPFKEQWYDAGHDLLYRVHRHGKIYDELAAVKRNRHPQEVRLVTADYRAARQHWVSLRRFEQYSRQARIRATVKDDILSVETDNVTAFSLDLRDAPLTTDNLVLRVDDTTVYRGPRAHLGHVIHLAREGERFITAFPTAAHSLEKMPGASGPITDAYFDSMVHVYGTGVKEQTQGLKDAAERGARGWPLWLWHYRHEVLADTEVTESTMRDNHLVLYGTPGANSVLEGIAERLPIRISRDGVDLGKRQFDQQGVGVKFIHPNPLAPGRYVIVQAAPDLDAVQAGHNLPDFLPDYVVYDEKTTRSRPRLVLGKANRALALGYFDRHWRVPDGTHPEGGGEPPLDTPTPAPPAQPSPRPVQPVLPDGAREPDVTPHHTGSPDAGGLPVPPAPPLPPAPTRFDAPAGTQAGTAARQIARRVPTFRNFRAETAGATWITDPVARWSIRSNRQCLDALDRQGIRVSPWQPLLPTPVPTPVELRSRVGGIWFRISHEDRVVLLSCEMARRLPAVVEILKRHKVRGVDLMSAYRTTPRPSFHTMGLALDLARFWTLDGTLSVLNDFEQTPDAETCEASKPEHPRGRALLDIACRLAKTRKFSTVLTPNYNEGHRDHFHIDSRPDDPRIFVR